MAQAARSTIVPAEAEKQTIQQLMRALAQAVKAGGPTPILSVGGESVPLSPALFEVLQRAAVKLAHGHEVAVLSVEEELSTEQAAEVLNVSRPFVIKLIERGELACRLAGTHRRLPLAAVLRYKNEQKARARAALREMVEDAQEQGMYEE